MASQHTGQTQPSIDLEEHRSVGGVNAKAIVQYSLDSAAGLTPVPIPLIDKPYDYVVMTSADGNGNYQVFTYKSGGSGGATVRTLTFTYDANSNVTSITRT